MPKAKPSAMMELWSINRWLRWTGVRLAIEVDFEHPRESPAWEPTKLGLVWWGWKDLFEQKVLVAPGVVELNVVTTPVVATTKKLVARNGHCGHAPKCINSDEHRDERDPLGCCNCGTRKKELELAALPPIDDQAESRLERLLVEKRKHFPGDAHKVRLHMKDSVGPAPNAALQPATDRCLNPIKGEFATWCKGCPYCGRVADKDSW